MLGVNVNAGTNAGHRIVRRLPMWSCRCKTPQMFGGREVLILKLHPGHRYSCSDCGARRP